MLIHKNLQANSGVSTGVHSRTGIYCAKKPSVLGEDIRGEKHYSSKKWGCGDAILQALLFDKYYIAAYLACQAKSGQNQKEN